MKNRKSAQVVFKPYLRGQLQLPTDLEELIPAGHVVRVVDGALDRMDLTPLLRKHKGGGRVFYPAASGFPGSGRRFDASQLTARFGEPPTILLRCAGFAPDKEALSLPGPDRAGGLLHAR